MSRVRDLLGTMIFWLSWPVIHISVRLQPRTRILVVSKDQVLVVMDLIGPGRWALPGGGIHRNETPLDGAVRELREETGIAVAPDKLQHKGTFETVNDEHHRYRYDYFVVELPHPAEPVRQKTELRAIKWVPYKELLADPRSGSVVKERVLAWFNR